MSRENQKRLARQPDEESLADGLMKFIAHSLAAALAKRPAASQHYSVARMADRAIEVYESL